MIFLDKEEQELLKELEDKVEGEVLFEPLFQAIREEPNAVWEKFEDGFRGLIYKMAYWKNFDKN